jgi:hypothetical protein
VWSSTIAKLINLVSIRFILSLTMYYAKNVWHKATPSRLKLLLLMDCLAIWQALEHQNEESIFSTPFPRHCFNSRGSRIKRKRVDTCRLIGGSGWELNIVKIFTG